MADIVYEENLGFLLILSMLKFTLSSLRNGFQYLEVAAESFLGVNVYSKTKRIIIHYLKIVQIKEESRSSGEDKN